jgi:DNA-binding MarR family transcriptional regulator
VSSIRAKERITRGRLLEKLAQLGREHSDATVLFHATMARLLDLNVTDYKTMSVLQRLGPMSAGEIAQHTGLATASVTNLVDRLERKGFVRRVHDSADRRRVMVEPIAEHLDEAHRRFASARQSLARFYDTYTDEELAVIADFLSRNAERLRAETKKIDPDRG